MKQMGFQVGTLLDEPLFYGSIWAPRTHGSAKKVAGKILQENPPDGTGSPISSYFVVVN
jgi:hypothetical protein